MKRYISAAALLLPSALAFASGGEAGHGGGGVPWGDIFKQAVNFAILATVLVYFLRKPLSDFLRERSQTLRASIEDAAKTKRDAAERMASIDARMAGLRGQVEAMNRKMEAEGLDEARKIREAAAAEIERIRQQATFAADQEVRKAKAELRSEAARLSAVSAEEIVRRTLTNEDQERLVRENIETIRESMK